MKLRAIVYAPWTSTERRMLTAASLAGMELYAATDLQDFGSQLFRDADAIGVLWSMGGASAAASIRRMREGNILNRITALIHTMEPTPERSMSDRAMALLAGADDAQQDSIDTAELAARLRAVAARGAYLDHQHLNFAGCTLHSGTGRLEGPGASTHLTGIEARLVVYLARNPSQVRSKNQILDALYGHGADAPDIKIVDIFVCKVRRKIREASGGLDCIRTSWGRGYAWVPEGFQPDMDDFRRRPRGRREKAEQVS
jgi:two-component system cell cycle response regulator CtrA